METMDTYRSNEFAMLIAKTIKTLQRWDKAGVFSLTNSQIYRHSRVFSPGQKNRLAAFGINWFEHGCKFIIINNV
jgi:hypothetical protein